MKYDIWDLVIFIVTVAYCSWRSYSHGYAAAEMAALKKK